MEVIERNEELHVEKFYDLDVIPIKMSLRLSQEHDGCSHIIVKLFYGEGIGNHFNHWSKKLTWIDRNQLIMMFEIFCELYHKAFKNMSYMIFNKEDINCILEVAEKNHAFQQKYLWGVKE